MKKRLNPALSAFNVTDYGTCPCGQKLAIGDGVVCHVLPMCRAYEKMPPIKFLRYVRKWRHEHTKSGERFTLKILEGEN